MWFNGLLFQYWLSHYLWKHIKHLENEAGIDYLSTALQVVHTAIHLVWQRIWEGCSRNLRGQPGCIKPEHSWKVPTRNVELDICVYWSWIPSGVGGNRNLWDAVTISCTFPVKSPERPWTQLGTLRCYILLHCWWCSENMRVKSPMFVTASSTTHTAKASGCREQIFARPVMQLTCAFPCDIAAVSLQISPSLEGTPAQTTWLHLCYCIYSWTYCDVLAMLKKG